MSTTKQAPQRRQQRTPNQNAQLHEMLLSEQEIAALASAFTRGRDGEGFTAEEFLRIVTWARRVRLQHTFIALAVAGKADVSLDANGQPIFRNLEQTS